MVSILYTVSLHVRDGDMAQVTEKKVISFDKPFQWGTCDNDQFGSPFKYGRFFRKERVIREATFKGKKYNIELFIAHLVIQSDGLLFRIAQGWKKF